MSVYKELFKTAEEIESKSRQIWPDSADYGVPISSNKDPIILQMKGIIEQYGGSVSTYNYSTGSDQTIVIEGYNEWSEKQEKVVFTFSYIHINKKFRGSFPYQGVINVTIKEA